MLVKKYGNRRLYDTQASRYITMEELARKVREGEDATVLDAGTGADLTQTTLAQIILENRGAARLLPVPLLTRLIRLGDDALGEFFARYLEAALDLYLQAKEGARTFAPLNPFAALSLGGAGTLARLFGRSEPAPSGQEEIGALRQELDELKRSLSRRRSPPRKGSGRRR